MRKFLPTLFAAVLGFLAVAIAVPLAHAAGTTATLNWTNPTTYNDCTSPPTGCTAIATGDIAGYTISWSRTSGGATVGSLSLTSGVATTANVPVACGTVFFTIVVNSSATAVYPNTPSNPTNPVSYATGVTCKPNPATGVTAT